MEVMNYSTMRQTLAKTIDHVVKNNSTVLITKGKSTAVLMSLEDYNAYTETAFLLNNPKNAERLMQSIAELKRGEGRVVSMEDLEALEAKTK